MIKVHSPWPDAPVSCYERNFSGKVNLAAFEANHNEQLSISRPYYIRIYSFPNEPALIPS